MYSWITRSILIFAVALVPWVSSASAAEHMPVNKPTGEEIAHWRGGGGGYWRGGGGYWKGGSNYWRGGNYWGPSVYYRGYYPRYYNYSYPYYYTTPYYYYWY